MSQESLKTTATQEQQAKVVPIKTRVIKYGALIAALSAIAYYIISHKDDFAEIKNFDPWALVPLFVAHTLYLVLYSIIFNILIKKFNVRLTFHEYFGLTIIKNFTNYFVPARLGMTTNSIYLRKKTGLSYAHFGSYFIAQSILVTASSAFYGLIGTYLVSQVMGPSRIINILYLCFSCALILITGLLCFSPKIKNPKGFFGRNMARLLEGWNIIRTDKMMIVRVFVLGFIGYCLAAVTIKYGFKAFGIEIPFKAAFLAGVLGSFANYINITPANLGVQESFFALMARIIGLGFNQGLLVSGLNRLVQASILFSLMPFYSWYLTSRQTKDSTQTNSTQQPQK